MTTTETMKMTMAAYARRHRVSKVSVSKWVKRGVVTLTNDGLVDVHKSDKRLAARPQRYRGGAAKDKSRPAVKGNGAAEPKPAALQAAIVRKELALAEKRELELAVMKREYVSVEEVCRQVEQCYAVVRERLLSIPGKIADACAMQPREEVRRQLDDEIRSALAELSEPAEVARRAAEMEGDDGE
jgi:hypothetical protein